MVPGQAILFMDITVAYQTFIISRSIMVSTLLDLSLFFEQDRHYTMWGAWLETPSYSELPLWSYFLILFHISLQKKGMLVKTTLYYLWCIQILCKVSFCLFSFSHCRSSTRKYKFATFGQICPRRSNKSIYN